MSIGELTINGAFPRYRELVRLVKDFSTDTDDPPLDMVVEQGIGEYSVAGGYLAHTETTGSNIICGLVGGISHMYAKARVGFTAATSAGSEDIMVLLRYLDPDNWYAARQDGGVFKITRRLAGSFTTVSQANYAAVQGTDYDIEFSAFGPMLRARLLSTAGAELVSLSGTDASAALARGGFALRSNASTMRCSSFTFKGY